jgi:hypothetical protein
MNDEKSINDAEQIVIDARLSFNYHPSLPEPVALTVLNHVQFYINCNRYTDRVHAELVRRSRGDSGSAMDRLWKHMEAVTALTEAYAEERTRIGNTPETPETLLDEAREAQTKFWDIIGALEEALGVSIDSTSDLHNETIESLIENGEEN